MHCCISSGISFCLSHVCRAVLPLPIDFRNPTYLLSAPVVSIIGWPSVCYTPPTAPRIQANTCTVAWPKWVPILSWITGWINVAGWVSGTANLPQRCRANRFIGRARGDQLPPVESTHCRMYLGNASRKSPRPGQNKEWRSLTTTIRVMWRSGGTNSSFTSG